MNDLKPVSHFLDRIPSRCKAARLHPSTVTRWITHGMPMADGTRLRLRATRVGMRWCLTEADWAAFLDAQTAAALKAFGADPPHPTAAEGDGAAPAGG